MRFCSKVNYFRTCLFIRFQWRESFFSARAGAKQPVSGDANRSYLITVMESLVDKKGRGEIWHETPLIRKRPDFFPIGLV